MRELKFHEQKLLKKVDFFNWKKEHNLHEIQVMRRYHVQKREDYLKYNKIVGMITKIVSLIKKLDEKDPFRTLITDSLLEKLFEMGLITNKASLGQCESVTASAFCRRRLPVVLCRMKMAETLNEAVKYVEQGHLRVGPEVVTDPAFLCTRNVEDFVTWTDTSRIKRHLQKYNNTLDDYDML